MSLKARYIEEIGTTYSFQVHWSNPSVPCLKGGHRHYGRVELRREIGPYNKNIGDGIAWLRPGDPLYPQVCSSCGIPVPSPDSGVTVDTAFSTKRLFNTSSGYPEPGDIYFRQLNCEKYGCGYGWKHCNGEHLHTVLPTGEPWDVDSRANNCTLKDDGEHRCWVRHGDPRKGELVHVDKNGLTCAAGAGSIQTDGWHGFLHNGYWTT